MLFKATELQGARLAAMDGPIGEVTDLFFDDQHWTIRYVVVDTGGWLSGRHVLISPASIRDVDVANRRVIVILTRQQVRDSPDVDTHQPISRRQEARLLAHYGMTPYWLGPMPWGPVPLPLPPEPGSAVDQEILAREEADESEDVHLHSTRDVVGYEIQACDDEIGHVDDFLIDGQAWSIRWLVIDTGRWLPGKKVLVSPEWVEEVSWASRRVRVALTRDRIEHAPEYDPEQPLRRDYEVRLFEYYGRRSYWDDAA
jgi:PRC-barrel domain protein